VANLNEYQDDVHSISLEQLVAQYSSLVKKIALYIKRRLPSSIELDDLLQSGLVGLIEAKRGFKNGMGASFETYAGIRIRGAIIDSLRKNAWVGRETLKNMRKVSEAINTIEQRDQQQASSEKIGKELGVTSEELFDIYQDINICNVMSLDEIDHDHYNLSETVSSPHESVHRESLRKHLQSILSTLPERDQQLLSLYYIEEFTFKQIGEILDLTEARICQLHAKLIAKVRMKMQVGSLV
jgi:RNA polymerase sigma factor for flagellar operon FliA